ncbi:MAG: MFS transporter [Acidimicrobiales bacterium]|nr:MFS transporter [Acidimicrobiales bacterium]
MTAVVGARQTDRWRLGLAVAAVLLAAADTYVVVVALPSMMSGVGVGLDRLQRATPIITGFLLGYTAVLPLIGRLADVAGPGPVLAGCLCVFAVGSVVTATAHSLSVMVAGRALQGLGGGGLVPVTLAIVASRWPPDARGLPLGVVGGVQELGSVLGPLYGAAIVTFSSWQVIFWVNVPVTIVIGAGLWWTWSRTGGRVAAGASPPDLVGMVLVVIGAAALVVGLAAPGGLADSVTFGRAWASLAGGVWSPFTTPVVLGAVGVLVLFCLWELAAAARVRVLVALRRVPGIVAQADLPGALALAGVLACIVVVFSTGDPSRQVAASSAPVLGPVAAVLLVAFLVRQRVTARPLIEPGALSATPAWGGLAVNLALGAALMAVLLDVPLFARATVDPGSEVSAALVLSRFLVAVPVGAVLGGALCRRRSVAPVVAASGMGLAAASLAGMATWSAGALGGGPRLSDLELVVCGLGFGLAVAPVNVAVLGAVASRFHALASSLAVVARTIGMLAGLSALTAVGLHRFYEAEARIGSPLTLCPTHPVSCPAYDQATTRAVLSELHTVFAGAAACAALAGLLALVLLGSAQGRKEGRREEPAV